jgi:hypothetical protein
VFEDESIMLAGYLRDIEEDAGWGIPYLRDIPWVGWIFGGKSTRKETVQRMFILTPHIVDLDVETLARLQATRLRDVTEAEVVQDDADASDEERERRGLERKENSERRQEKHEDFVERREAEIDHGREMRQFSRRLEENRLKDDKLDWKLEEKAEDVRVTAEEKAGEERRKAREKGKE